VGNQLEVTISQISTLIYGVCARVSLVGTFVRADVFPYVQLSIHGGDRPLLIVGLGLN